MGKNPYIGRGVYRSGLRPRRVHSLQMLALFYMRRVRKFWERPAAEAARKNPASDMAQRVFEICPDFRGAMAFPDFPAME